LALQHAQKLWIQFTNHEDRSLAAVQKNGKHGLYPAVRLAFVNDRFWEARRKSVGISHALNIWHNRTMGDLIEF
jgi:hypothetical protein